jgi:hypothetical protein
MKPSVTPITFQVTVDAAPGAARVSRAVNPGQETDFASKVNGKASSMTRICDMQHILSLAINLIEGE